MVQHCYTYRICIANRNNVQVEIRDLDNNSCGRPSGQFNYRSKIRKRIQELHQAASEGKLTSSNVEELGEKLFDALFNEGLRRDFFGYYEKVWADEDALLRIELDVDERQLPDVAALPWEFIRVPPKAGYGNVWLGTDPNLVFSRRRARWIAPKPISLKTDERLRIAIAVAAPSGLGPVKYEKIWESLKELADEQIERIELLELVNPTTKRSIDDVLKQKPHIFHFIGHAQFGDPNQQAVGQIALVDQIRSEPDWIGAESFGELFTRHRPGIVVLQACESAALSASEAFVGIASQVVQQNIPVVVAMQYKVSNATARSFALEFYRCLSENDPVDKAVQEARRCIALGPIGYAARDFATPVLFMRVQDGHLFHRPSTDLHPQVPDDSTSLGEGKRHYQSSAVAQSRVSKELAKPDDRDRSTIESGRKLPKTIDNPYVVGVPVRPPMFFGRMELLHSIQETFESKQPHARVISLVGLSRIGKTSVLHQLHRQTSGKCVYAFIDLQGAALEGIEGLLYYIARAIADALKRETVAKGFEVAEPRRKDFTGQVEQIFASYLEDILVGLDTPRLVLMIDEFDMLFDLDEPGRMDTTRKLLAYFRAMVQWGAFGMITVGDTPFDELPSSIRNHDFFNIILPKRVSFLDREAAIELIQKPTGLLKYEPRAIEYLLKLSGGHPCLLQYLCYHIVNLCNESSKLHVDLETIGAVVPLVHEHAYFLRYLMKHLAETEQRVILEAASLVESDKDTFTIDQLKAALVRGKAGLKVSQLENLLDNLAKREILAIGNHRNYRFTMEIFRRWLVESRPMSYGEA